MGQDIFAELEERQFNVQGWLMLPMDYDPAKKYPLIVEVHGGPASAALSHWGAGGGLSAAAFSALGYFVLQPNPRGSYGQGEEFTQANRKDFGYGDLRDILAGVDAVLAKYPVDPNRVGLTGWSYGGFMTMFAVTQTQRFKAAVAGAGISDWQSYYGENSIDQWMTAVLWRFGLRRSGGLREELGHQLHQAGQDANAGGGGRPGRRVPGAAILRVLARAAGTGTCPRSWWFTLTKGMGLQIRPTGAM